jgi:hypothetical protein
MGLTVKCFMDKKNVGAGRVSSKRLIFNKLFRNDLGVYDNRNPSSHNPTTATTAQLMSKHKVRPRLRRDPFKTRTTQTSDSLTAYSFLHKASKTVRCKAILYAGKIWHRPDFGQNWSKLIKNHRFLANFCKIFAKFFGKKLPKICKFLAHLIPPDTRHEKLKFNFL